MPRSGECYHLNIKPYRKLIWDSFKANTSQNLDLTTRIFSAIQFYLDNNTDLIIQDIPTLRKLLSNLSPERINLYANNVKQINMLLQEFQ